MRFVVEISWKLSDELHFDLYHSNVVIQENINFYVFNVLINFLAVHHIEPYPANIIFQYKPHFKIIFYLWVILPIVNCCELSYYY